MWPDAAGARQPESTVLFKRGRLFLAAFDNSGVASASAVVVTWAIPVRVSPRFLPEVLFVPVEEEDVRVHPCVQHAMLFYKAHLFKVGRRSSRQTYRLKLPHTTSKGAGEGLGVLTESVPSVEGAYLACPRIG